MGYLRHEQKKDVTTLTAVLLLFPNPYSLGWSWIFRFLCVFSALLSTNWPPNADKKGLKAVKISQLIFWPQNENKKLKSGTNLSFSWIQEKLKSGKVCFSTFADVENQVFADKLLGKLLLCFLNLLHVNPPSFFNLTWNRRFCYWRTFRT